VELSPHLSRVAAEVVAVAAQVQVSKLKEGQITSPFLDLFFNHFSNNSMDGLVTTCFIQD
jgi:hypothetical protein